MYWVNPELWGLDEVSTTSRTDDVKSIPCADDPLLPTLCVERLSKTINGIVDFIDISIGDLEGLRVAVNGADGMLDDIPPRLEANHRALYFLGKKFEPLQIGI